MLIMQFQFIKSAPEPTAQGLGYQVVYTDVYTLIVVKFFNH